MYSIEIENLTKKFKEKTAVNNVSLKIKQGELFSLLGTNGAGKTTTIKMLSTLILPTSGNIKIICKRKFRIYGRSISNKKSKRENL